MKTRREQKWPGAVSDIIIMLSGASVSQHSRQLVEWRFTGVFLSKLRRGFLFGGFRGRSARVAVYRGVPYGGLTAVEIHMSLSGLYVYRGNCFVLL